MFFISWTGMQNAVRSGMGLLGMHPSASLTHPISGQRMAGLIPLDLRPSLLQGAGGRFPVLMQQGLAHQTNNILDASLHVRARAPFSQMEQFNRGDATFGRSTNPSSTGSESLPKVNNEIQPRSDVGGQQEGDQDYRFPPPEKQSTGLLKTPPLEMRTDPIPTRPPLLERPPRVILQAEGRESRRDMSGGFRAESRWGPPRGDFDERDIRGMSLKGFQDERSNPNFHSRFDSRSGSSGPNWNRGASLNANMHQDYDDRRRPWERQKDRDDRDMDFRGEMNSNRHSRERDRERERDRSQVCEHGRERNRERERDRDREISQSHSQPLLPNPQLSKSQLLLHTPVLTQNKVQGQAQTGSPSLPVTQHQLQPGQQLKEPEIVLQAHPKSPSPSEETANSQEQEESSCINGPDTDSMPHLNMEPMSQMATELSHSPSPSLTSTSPCQSHEPEKEEMIPEMSVSSTVVADMEQTGPKVDAETEPELEKTDTEET